MLETRAKALHECNQSGRPDPFLKTVDSAVQNMKQERVVMQFDLTTTAGSRKKPIEALRFVGICKIGKSFRKLSSSSGALSDLSRLGN